MIEKVTSKENDHMDQYDIERALLLFRRLSEEDQEEILCILLEMQNKENNTI